MDLKTISVCRSTAAILVSQLKPLAEADSAFAPALSRAIFALHLLETRETELERTQPTEEPPFEDLLLRQESDESRQQRAKALRALSGDGILRTVTELNEARRREIL